MTTDPTQPEPQPTSAVPEPAPASVMESAPAPEAPMEPVAAVDPIAAAQEASLEEASSAAARVREKMASGSEQLKSLQPTIWIHHWKRKSLRR